MYLRAKVSHFSVDQLYINCITSKLFRPYQFLNSGKQPHVMNRSTHKRAEETKYSLHLSNDGDFSVWLIFLYQPGNAKLYLLIYNFTLTSKHPVKHFLGPFCSETTERVCLLIHSFYCWPMLYKYYLKTHESTIDAQQGQGVTVSTPQSSEQETKNRLLQKHK